MSPRLLLLLVALLVGPLSACSTNPATGERSFTAFMSPEEELKVGREQHPQILKEFGGEIGEAAVRDYVSRLGRAIAARSEMPQLDWHFTVLNSDIVNAFALPGGYVYVTRGLLALASSEAELAGVLGHEIGHVTARHSAQRYSSGVAAQGATVLATIVGAVLLGNTGAQLAQAAVGGGMQAALASYSREQELQADELGVRYLTRASYDPYGMARFLEKLQNETALQAELMGRPGAGDEFSLLQSHPRTPDRVRAAIREAGEAGSPANPRVLRDEYLRAIDGLAWGGDPENGFIKNHVFVHPGLRFRFEVPVGFHMFNSETAVMAIGPDNARILFDRDQRAPRGDRTSLAGYLRQVGARAVEEITIDGLGAATGAGQVRTRSGQVFDVRIVLIGSAGTVWRFQFLTPPGVTARYNEAFRRTTYSFDEMTAPEAAAQRPFRVRAVRVGASDSQESLARRMATTDVALRRFQVLNGLKPEDRLQPGQLVKVIGP